MAASERVQSRAGELGIVLALFTVLLASRGVRVVDWAGWLRLDSHERALGEVVGRERVKVVPRDEMLDISLGTVGVPTA